MSGLGKLINALDASDCNPVGSGDRYRAKCPSHRSRGLSLQITQGRSAPLIYCYAGCTYEEVLDQLGLKWRDLKDSDYKPVRKKEVWERHLEGAIRSGAKPVRVGDGVYHGVCSCGGQLYVGRPGAVCDKGCKISLDPVPQGFINPVSFARAYGCDDLKPTGEGVFVGTCPSCGGWLSAGPYGAFCQSNCPVEGVGGFLHAFRDTTKGAEVQKRVINILGCIEKKSGVSKAGRAYTIYQVHANDENEQPIQHELTSFEQLPQGRGEYWIDAKEGPYGTQYTVKTSLSQADQKHQEIIDRLTRIEAALTGSPVPPATVAAVNAAPATVTPIQPQVVESAEVPF